MVTILNKNPDSKTIKVKKENGIHQLKNYFNENESAFVVVVVVVVVEHHRYDIIRNGQPKELKSFDIVSEYNFITRIT